MINSLKYLRSTTLGCNDLKIKVCREEIEKIRYRNSKTLSLLPFYR